VVTFALPWMLLGLAALPGLWWLLKAAPLPPRNVTFPPIRLLIGLASRLDAPDRMPWWVLLLRLSLAAALIIAAAGPVLFADATIAQTTGPLLIAFDDDWAVATDWQARRQWIEDRLRAVKRAGRTIYLLPTAPPVPQSVGPLTADQALTLIRGWKPKPWAADRAGAAAVLGTLSSGTGIESVWVANGLEDGNGQAFIRALARLGNGPAVVMGRTARALAPGEAQTDLTVVVNGVKSASADVVALDRSGRELGRATTDAAMRAVVALPLSMRNQAARLVIEGEHSAAAVVLMDERSRRRTVALARDAAALSRPPLLDSLTYVDKAVQPFAETIQGPAADMLARKPSLLVLAATVGQDRADDLRAWIADGGMVIRFADETLVGSGQDTLLPTRLRVGGRELGGVMSWTEPQALAPFASSSPFAGLPIPADVLVRSQVLADPELDPDAQIWAGLADGTPLVTAKPVGRGWLVLFHCAATPKWSSLPVSGLFPEMLRRLVMMSAANTVPGDGPFAPVQVMDGYGMLSLPGGGESAVTHKTVPGPGHPPGLYGDAKAPMAFNLGPSIEPLKELTVPASVRFEAVDGRRAERDLRPVFLFMALLLGLADLVVAARLATVAVMICLVATPRAWAADSWSDGLEPRLAYVTTGNARIDAKSKTGLSDLTQVLAARSTAVLAAPAAVRLDGDNLAFYPLLYWPVTVDAPPLSDGAATAVKLYMKGGGLILFDRQDGGAPDPSVDAALRRLNRRLDLPPLTPIGTDHVLTRSFYLLRSMPGRFADGAVWIQADSDGNDGVATAILGSNDWAGAWAGMGDEAQREAAFRFGVNLCMYALTGNYKADQVHLPAILERLGRKP